MRIHGCEQHDKRRNAQIPLLRFVKKVMQFQHSTIARPVASPPESGESEKNRKKTRKPCRIYLQNHACSAFHNAVTLTYDLRVNAYQRHAKGLPCTIGLPGLVLIAQAIFLLQLGHTETQTHTVTDATDYPIPKTLATAGVG